MSINTYQKFIMNFDMHMYYTMNIARFCVRNELVTNMILIILKKKMYSEEYDSKKDFDKYTKESEKWVCWAT